MTILVTDPDLESRLIAERQEANSDRFDEVWEGLYVMPPLANDVHQEIQANFVAAIKDAFGWDSPVKVRAGVNVSDRKEDWTHNYRCPDVVAFLPGNPAVNHGTHWQGGPDFLVEILSKGDRSLEKLPFYSKVGVREALFVGRDPWGLELYAATGSPGVLQLVGMAQPDGKPELVSTVLPLSFQLHAAALRPRIHVKLIGSGATDAARSRVSWVI